MEPVIPSPDTAGDLEKKGEVAKLEVTGELVTWGLLIPIKMLAAEATPANAVRAIIKVNPATAYLRNFFI